MPPFTFTVMNKSAIQGGNSPKVNVQLSGPSGSMDLTIDPSIEGEFPVFAAFTVVMTQTKEPQTKA